MPFHLGSEHEHTECYEDREEDIHNYSRIIRQRSHYLAAELVSGVGQWNWTACPIVFQSGTPRTLDAEGLASGTGKRSWPVELTVLAEVASEVCH